MNKVLIPGTFDPITLGHLELIKTATKMFDEIYVGIFINPEKKPLFTLESRLKAIKVATKDIPNVHVISDNGYVSEYAKNNGISFILKGYRNETDFAYEKYQAVFNKERTNVDTLLIPSKKEYKDISSTLVRNNIDNEDILNKTLPTGIMDVLEKQ